MKKILSLMTILLVTFFVTACGAERTSPEADVNLLCTAYLHGDEASLQKVGMTTEEYNQQFIAEFTKSFTESSGLTFTDEQIKKVNDAMRNLLARSTFSTETVSENGDNATAKVTVSTLTMFTENEIAAKLPENIATLSEAERIDVLANALTEIVNEWQYTGNADFNVECKYNEEMKMWLPVDLENFGVTLAKKIFSLE